MDARVKPAHDELVGAIAKRIAPSSNAICRLGVMYVTVFPIGATVPQFPVNPAAGVPDESTA
jgi:hypothetical protein